VDLGVLLSLPVESIAIRTVIATLACVVLLRVLLRIGLRTPAARVFAAVTPAIVLLAVTSAAWRQPRLPTLMVPVEARDALAIRVAEGYLYFAPMVFPALLAAWAVIVLARLVRRLLALRAAHARALEAVSVGQVPGHVRAAAEHVARRFALPEPFVTVVPHAPGGAYVVGRRHPIVVLDATLVRDLDDVELEGVLAHELAHVRRRDNLVATALGTVRDAVFFAPGVGWAVRHLHRERELAADQAAVTVTGRPGALASGLLKVLEHGPRRGHACAAFAPSGGLVQRVQALVDGPPAPTRLRRTGEFAVLALVAAMAVAAAMVLPGQIAGADRQRDAVAVVWSSTNADAAPTGQARAFDVYERVHLDSPAVAVARTTPTRHDESSIENRRSTLRACALGERCPTPDHFVGLGLRPRPVVTVDDAVTRAWQATPVLDTRRPSSGLQMYWLSWID
jgi:Zn-dependent protease with chaperone function